MLTASSGSASASRGQGRNLDLSLAIEGAVFRGIQSRPQTPNKVGDNSPWQAACSDYRDHEPCFKEDSEVAAPSFCARLWLLGSAPTPSLLDLLLTVGVKNQYKSDLGFFCALTFAGRRAYWKSA